MKFDVSEAAAMKVLLHAARHSSSSICGLLLASKVPKSSDNVSIVDAIPLFHTNTIIGPCFETAIIQVRSKLRLGCLPRIIRHATNTER